MQVVRLPQAAFAMVLAFSSATVAGQVELKSRDQAVNISGNLLGFKDNNYIIDTNLGELRVPATGVDCIGATCPAPEVRVAAPPA